MTRGISVIAAAAAAMLGAAACASAASITLIPSEVGPRVYGQVRGVGMVVWFDITEPGIAKSLETAGMETTRWPGGTPADAYHWQTNTMMQCQEHPFHANAHSTFDNFMQDVAIPAHLDTAIVVNYGSNRDCNGGADPAEAVAWVAYANRTKHYNITWWTVGGELWNRNTIDMHSQGGNPAQYAEVEATQYYSQMKAASPIPIHVCVDVNPRFPNWDSVVLSRARYDCVEMHYYAQGPHVDDERLIRNGALNLTKRIRTLKEELAAAGHPDTPIYLGEIGSTGGRTGKQTQSIVQALYAAQVIGEIVDEGIPRATWWLGYSNCYLPENGGDFSSSLYGYQNFGGGMIFSGGPANNCRASDVPPLGTLLPTADAFFVTKYFVRDGEHVVGVRANSLPDVKVYASTYRSGYALLLVNRSENQSVSIPVRIEGRSSGSGGTIVTYDKQLYDASAHGEWLMPTVSALPPWQGSVTVNLPPWSITAVQIN
ncbi:MAG: hypothetical protein JO311_02735 [Candidatus Eremiobacteraeota bacterium]|nr:hypothetical protein [Candidatus Eremiobacteraeota bacterium]